MARERSELAAYAQRVLIALALAAVFGVTVFLLGRVVQVLLLSFAGALLALLLDGLARFLCRHTYLPRRWGLLVVVLSLLALGGGAVMLLGPRIAEQFDALSEQVPAALERLRAQVAQYPWGRRLIEKVPEPEALVPRDTAMIRRITGFFSTALGAVWGVIFTILVGLYVAFDPPLYVEPVLRAVPRAGRARAREIAAELGFVMRRWLVGRFAAMTVVGVLTTIGLWIAGIPLALSLGLLAGALSFVPFLGPIVSAIPGVLIGFLQSPMSAVWALVVYVSVQAVESNLITPLIEKRAVSLPPALIVAAQFAMATLAGLLGVLLATPLAVLAIVLIQMLYVEDALDEEVTLLGE